jgi:hypothetical protein
MKSQSKTPSTTMHNEARLHVPIEVTGDDVERALFEQSKDESAVAQVFERLRGAAAERAASELNRALAVDIVDVLAQGWAQAPAVHRAVQLSALTRGTSMLINVDWHNITSTSHVVLDTHVTESALPQLELALEILADVQYATLSARDGGIDLVALGEASFHARLTYKHLLVKEHATGIACIPRDPFKPRPSAADRLGSVDFPI